MKYTIHHKQTGEDIQCDIIGNVYVEMEVRYGDADYAFQVQLEVEEFGKYDDANVSITTTEE